MLDLGRAGSAQSGRGRRDARIGRGDLSHDYSIPMPVKGSRFRGGLDGHTVNNRGNGPFNLVGKSPAEDVFRVEEGARYQRPRARKCELGKAGAARKRAV